MTVRLSVDGAAWRRHVDEVVSAVPGLVPVVKGNGYGFGRATLAAIAASFADTIAVGTVHELADIPPAVTAVVLTPTLQPPHPAPSGAPSPVLTVGSPEHLDALDGWQGRVLVKLTSSMLRYGRGPELADLARDRGLDVIGYSIHPPLAGDSDAHRREITDRLDGLDPGLEVWVSHLEPATFASLPAHHRYRLRLGTLLWHGDKSMLHLGADVLDTRPVRAGEHAGYRLHEVPERGTLVMIGAGTAHGIHPLPDGRSPFHYRQRRMPLVEPPHMHTSMAIVPAGTATPAVGDTVDVQRPLTTTLVDEVSWD